MTTPTAITASQLITDALRLLNVIREIETPSAEQQAQCIRALNEMMALWEADGNQLGYIPVGTVTDKLTVPDGAILGIKSSLAIVIAPFFGASVSQELVASAKMGMQVIEKLTAKEPSMVLDVPSPADACNPVNFYYG
jgi:hypothetical protein